MPQVAPSPSSEAQGALPEGSIAPHQEALGLTPLMGPSAFSKRYASALMDPNDGWSSGFGPLQVAEHGVGNAYLDHGDPLESNEVMDNAGKIDTGWHSLKTGDGGFDETRAKQAIVNAFRVVLLSPRKDLRWNAIHYQDIAHIPADVDDPKVYWDALESRRRSWNQAQGIDPNAHMPYFKYLKPFESVIYQLHPELGFEGAKKKADDTLFAWWTEEQQRIETEDEDKPTGKQRSVDEIERRANESLARRIQTFLKDKTNPATDVAEDNPEHLRLFGAEDYVQKIRQRFDGVNLEDATVKFKASQIENFLSKSDIPDGPYKKLMRLYGYLAKTKGGNVTAEDVHDAWVYWTVVDRHDTDDDCLVPYSELSSKSKAYDEPYKKAIHKTAAGGQYNLLTGEEGLKYGAFMGTHLKAIAQISRHADGLLDAALEDVKSHDGTGHHFRAKVLSLGVSGVGPKVASFAWLLLQPMTSQLATIDTHMMDILGHKYEKEMNSRDYFKFERELAAGRDAAGYEHIPLGAFQWGMWDHKRTGPGTHQDHSAMAVLDPTPHQYVDWNAKVQPIGGGHAEAFKQDWASNAPDWWRNTQPARDAVATEWQENVAPGFPQGAIPYQVGGDPRIASMLRESGESVDEFHVGIAVPEHMVTRLSEIAKELDLKKPEEAAEYHITAFWSEKGYSEKALHDWVRNESISGYRFENARIDCFPSQKGDWAVVLRLDAPEAKKHVHKLMDEAEDRGLEIRKFDGGWKAHITLGYQDEKVKPQKFPDVQFRSGPMYVSIPRPLRKSADYEPIPAFELPGPWIRHPDGDETT
jgi:2'-5' RNA ligase